MKQNIFTRYFHNNRHYKKNPKNMKQNIITRAQEGHYPSLADVRRRGHLKRVGTAHAVLVPKLTLEQVPNVGITD